MRTLVNAMRRESGDQVQASRSPLAWNRGLGFAPALSSCPLFLIGFGTVSRSGVADFRQHRLAVQLIEKVPVIRRHDHATSLGHFPAVAGSQVDYVNSPDGMGRVTARIGAFGISAFKKQQGAVRSERQTADALTVVRIRSR